MRALILVLCWTLTFSGMPAWADASREQDPLDAPPSALAPTGLERAWPPRPLGVRLAQATDEEMQDDLAAQIAELQAQRNEISLEGPRFGIFAGTGLLVVGVGVLVIGGIVCFADDVGSAFDDDDDGCRERNIYVASGILGGLGVMTAGYGGLLYSQRSRERKALDERIWELRERNIRGAERAAPRWSIGFEAGDRKTLHLGWRY